MQKYTTIKNKLESLSLDLSLIDIYELSEKLRSSGATVSGYTTNNDDDGKAIELLYDNTEGFDSALERCGVPTKKIEEKLSVRLKERSEKSREVGTVAGQ